MKITPFKRDCFSLGSGELLDGDFLLAFNSGLTVCSFDLLGLGADRFSRHAVHDGVKPATYRLMRQGLR